MGRTIDVHHHAMPPEYLAEMKKHGIASHQGFVLKPFDPKKNLKVMDKLGIDTAYLSISAPGSYIKDDATSGRIARICNRYLKECRDAYPERYGAFATVPYPAKNESVAEVEYALNDLGFDGVCMMSYANGHYFGEPGYDDLFRAFNERGAIVYVHPNDVRLPKGVHMSVGAFFERMLESTRCASNLLLNGYLERYPNIRFIFSHGGGGIPVMARRIVAESFRRDGREPDSESFESRMDLLRGCFFDTAQRGLTILNSLEEFCGSGHIVCGTDYPYVPAFEIGMGFKELRTHETFTDEAREGILGGRDLFAKTAVKEAV